MERKHLDPARTTLDPLHAPELPGPGRRALAGPLQREAVPGANGVSPCAERAVEAASSSAGQSLPGALQRKFEASLGADLSGVRIHTGEASQEAARAVSARAFTLGNDVHFGAGQFDPSSHAGQHLIAHEVAHTVQQGGVARRAVASDSGTSVALSTVARAAQFKLDVSSPGDALEVEADRAADIMLGGAPAPLAARARGHVGAGVARKIMRSETTDLQQAGDTQAQQATQALANPATGTTVGRMSAVRDASQATEVMSRIDGAAADLEDGRGKGDVTSGQIVANEHCKNLLSSFLVTAGEQGRTLNDFQIQVNQCMAEFARLQGMIAQFSATRSQLGGATDAAGGQRMAGQIVGSASGGSGADMASRVQQLAGTNPAFQGAFNRMQELHARMESLSIQIGSKQNEATAATSGFIGAVANLEAGATTRGDADPATTAALAAVRQECEAVKKYVGMALDQVKAAATTAATAAGIPAGAASAAAGQLPNVANLLVDSFYEGRISSLENKLAIARQHQSDFEYESRLSGVRQAKSTWIANINEFNRVNTEFNTAKNQMRTTMNTVVASAQASHNSDIAIVATFLGEADRFVAQLDATLGLGEAEKSSAANAREDRRRATHPDGDGSQQGVPYYTATRIFHPMHTGWSHSAIENHVQIFMYGDSPGSSEGAQGVNPVVDRTLEQLTSMKGVAVAFRNELGQAMGMGDLGPGRAAGPNGPSAPSTATPGGH